MGTTSVRWTKCTHKEFNEEHLKEFVQNEYGNYSIAMIHFVRDDNDRHQMYSIMRNVRNESFICVTTIEISNNEIYWKDITEDMGPTFNLCAPEFFKWLAPQNDYAIEWRKRCLKNNRALNQVFL